MSKITKEEIKTEIMKLRFTPDDDISELNYKGNDTYTFHCPFCDKVFEEFNALPKQPRIVQCSHCGMRTVIEAVKGGDGKYRWIRRRDKEIDFFTGAELRKMRETEQENEKLQKIT